MCDLEIVKWEYRGFEYTVKINLDSKPNLDADPIEGIFYIDRPTFDVKNPFPTFEEAVDSFKRCVDEFLENIPQTKKEWYEEVSNCMVWTWYKDCHLDEKMLFEV